MSSMRSSGKKSGNNTLIFIAGGLAIVLVLLIFIGSGRQSSIDQLLMSAAPDSSGFIQDSTATVSPEELPEAPVEVKRAEADTPAVVKSPTTEIAQDTAAKPASADPVVAGAGDGNEKTILYKIRKGDTMYKIAAKFGNKPADILEMNGLTDMGVQADKMLKVKIKELYQAEPGEGLLSVAEKFGVPVKSVKVANDLTSDQIPSGARLIIPLK